MEPVLMECEKQQHPLRVSGDGREQTMQHPYGVGRFVDAAAWMNTVTRMGGDIPPKYRSTPKLFSHPDEHSSPASSASHVPAVSDRHHQTNHHHHSPDLPRIVHNPSHHPRVLPNAMARRNERERKRVRLVNHGFATLREYLPQGNARKKLSKMETLRSAIEYIKQLQYLLDPPSSATGYDPSCSSSQSDDGRWPGMATDHSSMGVWEEAMGWTTQGSPGSAGSSPHTSLSPDTELIDFSSFS